MREQEVLLSELESYRRTLFIGVTLSTSAVISSVFFVPLLFFHLQTLQTSLSHELHFCTIRSHNLWDELREVERSVGVKSRIKRQNFLPSDPNPITYPYLRKRGGAYQTTTVRPSSYNSPQYVEESTTRRHPITVRPIIEQRRSSICIFGPPGPPGEPGNPGRDGPDGYPGPDGSPARDFGMGRPQLSDISFCQQCAAAEPGRPGQQGQKGYPGPPGPSGQSFYGRPNPPGPMGSQGLPGLSGRSGLPGMSGMPGLLSVSDNQYIEYGPRGIPGPAGPPGATGEPGIPGRARYGSRGQPGDPGAPGKPGNGGIKGASGPRGYPGALGSCSHCPVPQLAPGYR